MRRLFVGLLACLASGACASLPAPSTVVATSRTAPVEGGAGDVAIWSGGFGRRARGTFGGGFVAAAGRPDGLVIYRLDGSVAGHASAGRPRDLDVAALPLRDSYTVVIAGSEQIQRRTYLTFYRLDREGADTPRRWASIPTGLAAPHGFCMRQKGDGIQGFAVDRRGDALQFLLSEGDGGEPVLREVRRFRLPDLAGGCAIDPQAGVVYFPHRRAGFWRQRLDPADPRPAEHLAATAPHSLPRAAGISLLVQGQDRFLVTLDRGRPTFSVWRPGPQGLAWLGRVEVRSPDGRRRVRPRMAADAYGDEVGPFPEGLVVVQDSAAGNDPDLKLVGWPDVRRALGF